MKLARISLALAGMVTIVLTLAAPASASTAVVHANDSYSVEVGQFYGGGPIMQGSDLSFTWSSTSALTLVVSGPSGVVESYSSSTQGSHTIQITETGTYFMAWTNSGSVDATVTYDYTVDFFGPVEDTFDAIVLAMVVAAIVIVVIIVLVVVLVLRGDRRRQPLQGTEYVQPLSPIAPTATSCPNCGAAINGTHQFCARCGARLR